MHESPNTRGVTIERGYETPLPNEPWRAVHDVWACPVRDRSSGETESTAKPDGDCLASWSHPRLTRGLRLRARGRGIADIAPTHGRLFEVMPWVSLVPFRFESRLLFPRTRRRSDVLGGLQPPSEPRTASGDRLRGRWPRVTCSVSRSAPPLLAAFRRRPQACRYARAQPKVHGAVIAQPRLPSVTSLRPDFFHHARQPIDLLARCLR